MIEDDERERVHPKWVVGMVRPAEGRYTIAGIVRAPDATAALHLAHCEVINLPRATPPAPRISWGEVQYAGVTRDSTVAELAAALAERPEWRGTTLAVSLWSEGQGLDDVHVTRDRSDFGEAHLREFLAAVERLVRHRVAQARPVAELKLQEDSDKITIEVSARAGLDS